MRALIAGMPLWPQSLITATMCHVYLYVLGGATHVHIITRPSTGSPHSDTVSPSAPVSPDTDIRQMSPARPGINSCPDPGRLLHQ